MKAAIPAPKVQMFALVRDKNGKPKIDGDPKTLHPGIISMMTPEEYQTAIKDYEDNHGNS